MGPLIIYHGTAYNLPQRPLMMYRFERHKADMVNPKLTTKPSKHKPNHPRSLMIYLFCKNGLHQDRFKPYDLPDAPAHNLPRAAHDLALGRSWSTFSRFIGPLVIYCMCPLDRS
eukprot:449733-Amphidinium_carterae.1